MQLLSIIITFSTARSPGQSSEGPQVDLWEGNHQTRTTVMVAIVMTVMMVLTRMALAQIPISTFYHIWVFAHHYGMMFVIIVIIIIIIIIIYRKVKVSTLKHV